MAKAKKAEKEVKLKKEKKPKASSRAVALDEMAGKLAAVGFDISSLMDDALDLIEKKTKVSSQDAARHAPRVSTGQLALDMYLDGGIVPGGWYTFFGGEQSCKSTTTMSIMASLVKLMYTGIAVVFDYEGSTDAEYVAGQLKTFGVTVDPKTIFGVKDDKTGGWLIKPKIRYYAPDNGGRFFDYMSMLRRRLPDKVVEKDGTAWLIFENTKENRAKVEGKYDKKYFSAHNQFKVPATDGHMQAVILVDSYPAMLPDQLDDDDGSNAMAIQARMFSDGIKRFRGGMRRKMMTIVGVNQVRQRPATMFGNPEYEPCGDALKFYCFASDTPIKTDCGVLTAPQIKEILEHNGTVCVETLNGYQRIESAWPVDDAPYPIELDALGHGYVGSAKHRQLVFIQDMTHDGQIVMRTEWRTLEELTKFHGDRFAAVRFGTLEELQQNTPDEYDDSHEDCLHLVDSLGVKTVELSFGIDRMGNTMAEQYAMIDTSEIANTTYIVENFAQIGIIAIKQDKMIVLPGIEASKLRDIVAEGITVEQSNLQRHTMMMLACDQFPELAKFCMEYNMLTTFGNTESTGALLIDNENIKARIDRLLDADFELSSHYAEDYDLLHQQLAYVEDFYMFDGQIVPVPFTLNVVTDRKIDFWDVNVPETGVVITNGLVSHNSDVRIKLTSRAVPDGWPKMKDSPSIVGEKSVTVEGGTDRYRFIAAKTIKNKMGGIPNQQTWMRLWEADGNGEARGFDPVFDCWHYLKTLGLINGPRKGFKIKSPCPLASDVKMDWDDFRTLINGTKPQIKAVCDKLKVKPAGLRLWCFKFVQSEKGRDMLRNTISKSAKASVEDDADE